MDTTKTREFAVILSRSLLFSALVHGLLRRPVSDCGVKTLAIVPRALAKGKRRLGFPVLFLYYLARLVRDLFTKFRRVFPLFL